MRLSLIYIFVVLAFGLGTASSLRASQDAIVTVDKVEIMQEPDDDSVVLEVRNLGEKLRVSNYSKNGWYKVRAKSGAYGWIWQANLSVGSANSDVKASDLDLKRKEPALHDAIRQPWFFIRVVGSELMLFSSDISQALGASAYNNYLATGGFGEISFRIDDRLRFAVRGGYFQSNPETISANGIAYTIGLSSLPLMAGFYTDIIQAGNWDFGAGIYGGVAYYASLSVTTNQGPPNSFNLQSIAPTGLVNLSAKYNLNRNFGLLMELGAYYSQSNPVAIPTNFNGASPTFIDVNGNLTSVRIKQLGPVASLGIEISL